MDGTNSASFAPSVTTQPQHGASDRFLFQGEPFDSSTGLYKFGLRQMDPRTGTFISQDPTGFGGGDPNLMRFVGNGPTNFGDPSGLEKKSFGQRASDWFFGQFDPPPPNWGGRTVSQDGLFAIPPKPSKGDAIAETEARLARGNIAVGSGKFYGPNGNMTAFQALSQAANESSWMIGAAMASAAVAPLVPIIGPMDAIIIAAYLGSAAGSASQGDYFWALRKMAEGPGQIMAAHALAHMMTVEIMASRACFPAGTLVSTAAGHKPIERIECGDRVWAFDFVRSEWRLCDVLETYQIQHCGDIVDVQLGEEVIQSTDGHPFWVVRGEGLAERPEMTHCPTYEYQSEVPGRWVYAKDLRVGDELLLHNGERVAVDGLTIHQEEVPVYNFAVAELHSYAVGCSEVLVHNENATRAGTLGKADHIADVRGAGRQHARSLRREGERVLTERPLEGFPGIRRRPDNQIVGTDGRTRVVIESERRPDGPYHRARIKQLECLGIEVITRPPSVWGTIPPLK